MNLIKKLTTSFLLLSLIPATVALATGLDTIDPNAAKITDPEGGFKNRWEQCGSCQGPDYLGRNTNTNGVDPATGDITTPPTTKVKK